MLEAEVIVSDPDELAEVRWVSLAEAEELILRVYLRKCFALRWV